MPTHKRPKAGLPAALANFDDLPGSAYVRMPTLTALYGVGPATIWRWAKSGRLPAPVKLGPNTTGWLVADLRQARPGGA